MTVQFAIAPHTIAVQDHAADGNTPPRPVPLSKALIWRAFDIVVAAAILIVALPFLIVLAVLFFVADPGPLFFVHRRIGCAGRSFGCIKFRTMKVNGDEILREHLLVSHSARREWAETQKLRNDPRITPIGAIARKLSLDEFPQLINVLRGQMSIVGPRPIVESEAQRYGRYFEHYCQVKPGLTGLWQISGRNDTTYNERIALDVRYVSRKSLLLDTWLVIMTVPAVLFARGSY